MFFACKSKIVGLLDFLIDQLNRKIIVILLCDKSDKIINKEFRRFFFLCFIYLVMGKINLYQILQHFRLGTKVICNDKCK